MKKNIVMTVKLKSKIFFKISHDLEESPKINIRRDHIFKGSFSTRRKLLFNEQVLISVVEPKKFTEASKDDD